MRFAVRVTPRGGRDEVQGWGVDEDGRPILKVRVSAAAAEGAANAAVVGLLARALARPRSAVRVVRGATSRIKQVEVGGIGEADLERAFDRRPG
jgi:uncharacterized protein YggU (UPF0235/DUF167 family)